MALGFELLVCEVYLKLHFLALHCQLKLELFHLELVFAQLLRALVLLSEVALLQAIKVGSHLVKLLVLVSDGCLLYAKALLQKLVLLDKFSDFAFLPVYIQIFDRQRLPFELRSSLL